MWQPLFHGERRRRADHARHERRPPADASSASRCAISSIDTSAPDWVDARRRPATWEAVARRSRTTSSGRRAARPGAVSSTTSGTRPSRTSCCAASRSSTCARSARASTPTSLTLGFARRLATYKRLHLLTHDPDRARRILAGAAPRAAPDRRQGPPERRGGQGHPAARSSSFEREVGERSPNASSSSRTTTCTSAQQLVSGCDVWVNLPRRPMEASGTSGMKATFNGALQLSVLDGWWAEGYDGANGWAIPGDEDDDPRPPTRRRARSTTCSRTR